MASEVKIKIAIDDDGTLSLIGAKAKKAGESLDDVGKSTDKLGKKRSNYNKLEKGAAQLTSNSTKAFAKQAQTIGGGLVPAYAILASNVFALSAAFNFFKQAADVQLLEQSQVAYATNTGVALSAITQRLRDASGAMLGFREAGEAAAIGLAKGFSPSQLEALAEGARKASTALGRNFQDSFDRLIRGASKAEPELLDELGITLRLEEATEKYAKAIGKNRNELNAFERSQAVLIETQKQLNENFGAVEGATNPFVRLAKTFEDIVKQATQFMLPAFEGLANIISNSAGAAIAAFGLLAMGIFKTIAPMDIVQEKLDGIRNNAATNLDEATKSFDKYKQKIIETGKSLEQTRQQGALDAQTGLQGYSGDSKTLKKLAAGQGMGKGDLQQLNKILKGAEKQIEQSGKITTGKLQGFNAQQLGNLRKNYSQMTAVQATFVNSTVNGFKRIGLSAQQQFAKARVAGTAMFLGLAKVAQKAGGVMDKALSLAGFIGIIVLVKDIASSLMDAPFTIIMGFANMLDTLTNIIFSFVNNSLAPPFLTAIDSIKNAFGTIGTFVAIFVNSIAEGVARIAEGILNFYKTIGNKAIEFANQFRKEKIELFDTTNLAEGVKLMDDSAPKVSNLAGEFVPLNDEGQRFKDMALEQPIVQRAKAHEEERAAVKRSLEAYKSYNALLEKSADQLGQIIDGLDAQEDPLKRTRLAFEGIASLDIPGLFQKINATQTKLVRGTDGKLKKDKQFVMSEKERIAALNDLKVAMSDIGVLSPAMAAALEAVTLADGGGDGLEKLSAQVTNAMGNLLAFEKGLESVAQQTRDSLSSGSFREALNGLETLRKQGTEAGKGIDALVDPKQAKLLDDLRERFKNIFGTEKDADALIEKLRQLTEESESLAVATAKTSLLSGQGAAFQKAENKLRQTRLEIDSIQLQIKNESNIATLAELKHKKKILEVDERAAKLEKERTLMRQMQDFGGGTQQAGALDRINNIAVATEIYTTRVAELNKQLVDLTITQAEFDAAINAANLAKLNVMGVSAANALKSLGEEFKKLGPEGDLMGTISVEMGNMLGTATTAMAAFGAEGATAADKLMAGMAAVSSVLSGIGAISQASSNQRIRGIDDEIKAEQKRDGKSKESLAKIAAMEKKKDNIKRKQFNINKKISMAQAVIATATGVVEALKLGPIIGPIMAGVIAAMGAAQLAIISGTSYQSSSATAQAPGPASASIGSRRSTVDISKSRGGASELAYLRGGQGIGGPENFQPAFTGYKNRNYGGRTGFMVGEQGPELFVPERQGSIIPADDTEQLMDGGSNVTFNINTIDASGVEDVLVAQQGNIIGMLRTAANSYGQDFFESVDESVYTTPAVGRA